MFIFDEEMFSLFSIIVKILELSSDLQEIESLLEYNHSFCKIG